LFPVILFKVALVYFFFALSCEVIDATWAAASIAAPAIAPKLNAPATAAAAAAAIAIAN
jgi:hypothetical protein